MKTHCSSVMFRVCCGASKLDRSNAIAAVKVTLTKHSPRTPGPGSPTEFIVPPYTQSTSVPFASGGGRGPRPAGTAAGRHASPWPPAAHSQRQPLMPLAFAAKHTASVTHAPQSNAVTGAVMERSDS
ncbi:uncharacterized protein Tco025E_03974 [Trypanosoma conorhini]|uniref:Uncharacterized protein n=1 Tax=Trypanosoma conorhini TaxID=83891 RepID=A0A3R7LSJ3_9TRYP|nr:uncharacterized protein Tco025E_03974 [Trypanosoma conorhini]RNF19835.1 hypothetical protein Tco025E_03974 [Trypanosoma conorhini]